MNQLELKHIAPYLPYGLKTRNKLGVVEIVGLRSKCNTNENLMLSYRLNNHIVWGYSYENKPILLPMSDLTKEIDGVVHARELGKLAINIQKPESLFVDENGLPNIESKIITKPFGKVLKVTNGETWLVYLSLDEPFRCHHYIIEYLFQHHFDIYGLIEKGLAIDINQLGKEVTP